MRIKKLKGHVVTYVDRNGFGIWFIALLLFTILLVFIHKLELLPATFFSAITVLFSYWAYKFSKEKFRLDLFDKRWEIYNQALDFCSIVTHTGSLKKTEHNKEQIIGAIKAANQSFRGIGWHKTRALFGEEIHLLFKELNDKYIYLSVHTEIPTDSTDRAQWAKKNEGAYMFIWDTVQNLPEVFKPYMYFGDYKRL